MKKVYGSVIWSKLKEYGVWHPGDDITLGDYGLIRDNCFFRLGHISDLIDDLTPQSQEVGLTDLAIISGNGKVTKQNNSAGYLAGISYEFDKNQGLVMHANGVRALALVNLEDIADRLMSHNAWKRRYHLVTSVRYAEEFVLLITDSTGRKITISAPDEGLTEIIGDTIDLSAKLEFGGAGGVSFRSRKPGPISLTLHRKAWIKEGFNFANSRADEQGVPRFIPETRVPETISENPGDDNGE